MTPIAQMSAFELYGNFIQTSGGQKYGVPHKVRDISDSCPNAFEIPKSPSLRTLSFIKMFYVLTSL